MLSQWFENLLVQKMIKDLQSALPLKRERRRPRSVRLTRLMKKNSVKFFFNTGQEKKHWSKPKEKGSRFHWNNVISHQQTVICCRQIILPGVNSESSHWYVRDLFPGDGYATAIAIEGGYSDISCRHYSLWDINLEIITCKLVVRILFPFFSF